MRYKLGKSDPKPPSTTSVALAVFAIICGLLVMAGSPRMSCGYGFGERRAAQRILRALKSVARAEQALAEGNYGMARSYVQSTQDTLTNALGDLQGHSENNWRHR